MTQLQQAAEILRQHDAVEALQRFIEESRVLQPYPNVIWNEPCWSIGTLNVKARPHLSLNRRLWFLPHDQTGRGRENPIPFEAPFANLVKACIVRRRVERGMESGTQLVFLRATRYLYDALPLPVRRNPNRITRGHFVAAETACIRREKPTSAYRACTFLEEFARMLDRYQVCETKLDFRTSARRPIERQDRTSSKFKERVERLPTAPALNALATVANNARLGDAPLDLLRMRITELLLVCGFRAGEVLTLPASPLIRELVLDEGRDVPGNARIRESVEKIGLRYWPEKGGEPLVKWVTTQANPLVLRAIEDIERLCGPARRNARWLEENPGDVQLDVGDDEHLTTRRAGELVGLAGTSFLQWLRQRRRGGDAVLKRDNGQVTISGANLRRAIAADRFDQPVVRRSNGAVQTLGETLLVMFMWDWSENRSPNRFISLPVKWGALNDFLVGRESPGSVFKRYGIFDEQGNPFRIRTHDFRRLLNIVGQRGGLSQVEIAQWMGRRRIEDNSAYDLRTATEMADEMRTLIEKNEVFGSITDQVQALPVTERAEFLKQRLTMLHTTPHGQCGSNIAENPCETAVSCLGGCRHYLRKKNDTKSRASLLRIEQETVIALERAREAEGLGKPNAKNWLRTHETVLATVRAALAIDDDSTVGDGELRTVNPNGPVLGEPL
jgi:hypothetical protein